MPGRFSSTDRYAPKMQGRFSWTGLAAAAVGAGLIGLAWARIGAVLQSHLPPTLVLPAVLGALVGLTFVALTRFARLGHRPTILAAAASAALIAVAGSGCQLCKTFSVLNWTVNVPAAGVAFDPVVALLAAALAAAVALPAANAPFCDRCGRWFRTTRNGKIDEATLRRLAESAAVECPDGVRSPRFRLSACRCDGGLSRLELSWERLGGGLELAAVWLDADETRAAAAILDNANGDDYDAESDDA